MIFVGRAASGQEISTTVAGEGDPYALTPRIVAECAVCLTQDGTTATGGVWTAAAALGEPLRRRLEQRAGMRSEEHTSELQSLMRISYAVFCLKKKKTQTHTPKQTHTVKHNHTNSQNNNSAKP